MKRLLSVLLIAVMLFASLTVFAGCTPREDTLKILNWEYYIDEDMIDDFIEHIADTENGRKIKVDYNTDSLNEDMYSKIKHGRNDFDLICPSDYMIAKMAREGLLKEINFDNVPNAANTSEYIKSLYSGFTTDISPYVVGYTWGTMGIVYNPEMLKTQLGYNDAQVEELVSSWNALWAKDPQGNDLPKLKKGGQAAVADGTITMKDSIRDSFFVASTYVNGNAALANDTSTDNLRDVKAALNAQNGFLRGWEVDELRDDIVNTSKNISMGLQWAGEAKISIDAAAENGVTLKYSVPSKEGSNVFFDGWVIPAYSEAQELAEKFLNFMCDPSNAARNMEYIGYTSVIAAEELFDIDFIANDANAVMTDVSYFLGQPIGTTFKPVSPVYYPEKSVLDKCYVMLDFGDRDSSVQDMWNTAKAI